MCTLISAVKCTDLFVSQLQLIQTYLLVDATLTDMHACRV